MSSTPRNVGVLRWLFGALALAGSASMAASCASQVDSPGEGGSGGGGVDCGAGETACDTGCVDVATDPFNCGMCDHVCASKQCIAGVCKSACAPPLTECNATCVDTSQDPNNCGLCGLACDAPLVCNSGQCGAACEAGKTNCGGVCLDLETDVLNCGTCGKKCPAEATCTSGNCQSLCSPGQSYCSGTCADLQTDEQHCGSCPNSCAIDETCEAGTCTKICQAPDTYCSGACVDLTSDLANCGQCGKACTVGQSCTGSQCICPVGVCGSCGVTDLGSAVPQTVSGTTVNGPDQLEGSCSATSPEVVYQFTASTAAHYVFHASATYEVAVYVLSSAACGEKKCKENFLDVATGVDLAAGEVVYVVVDGYFDQGSYTLDVTSGPIVPCPADTIGPLPATKTGSTLGGSDELTPACSASSTAPEATFSFTAPADGTYHFDTAGSSFDTVLHVLDGSCNGASLACDDDGIAPQSTVDVPLLANQTVVVVVDGYSSNEGSYVLNASELILPPCPETDLGSTFPQSTNGATAGQSYFGGICGGGSAPERTFGFTAPQAGPYTFTTAGSSFDTVLYVRDGTCNGPELDCDDDGLAPQSTVTVNLAANQTVVVFVDGYSSNFGPFTLNIQ